MNDEQAEARFQHQLQRKKMRAQTLETDAAEARHVADEFEKNKKDYIAYYKVLP